MQRLDKGFCWSLEAETFSWSIIVVSDYRVEAGFWQVYDVGFSGECASEASNGVFDAPFLPRRAWVAEVGLDVEQSIELLVSVELGAVVEGDGLAEVWREGFEHLDEALGDGIGLKVGLWEGDGEAGMAFVSDQDGGPWL